MSIKITTFDMNGGRTTEIVSVGSVAFTVKLHEVSIAVAEAKPRIEIVGPMIASEIPSPRAKLRKRWCSTPS